MKTCPQCGKTYPDEYAFCLSDGAPLNDPVVAADEEPTVVRQPQPAPPQRTRQRMATSTILLFVLAGILTLALGATIAVLYAFWPRRGAVEQAKTTEPTPTATPTPNRSSPSPSPTVPPQTPAPPPTPEDESNPDETPPAGDERPADPGTTRITFGRGRIEETLSGRVSSNRSFALYAKPGQNLTARVQSEEDCVQFDDESRRLSYETNGGDNLITLVNTCDAPARFTMSVRIR